MTFRCKSLWRATIPAVSVALSVSCDDDAESRHKIDGIYRLSDSEMASTKPPTKSYSCTQCNHVFLTEDLFRQHKRGSAENPCVSRNLRSPLKIRPKVQSPRKKSSFVVVRCYSLNGRVMLMKPG